MLAEVDRGAAVRASVITRAPLEQTGVAAQLVALEAFLRVLDDEQTDCAREVRVQAGHGLLGVQLLCFLLPTALVTHFI